MNSRLLLFALFLFAVTLGTVHATVHQYNVSIVVPSAFSIDMATGNYINGSQNTSSDFKVEAGYSYETLNGATIAHIFGNFDTDVSRASLQSVTTPSITTIFYTDGAPSAGFHAFPESFMIGNAFKEGNASNIFFMQTHTGNYALFKSHFNLSATTLTFEIQYQDDTTKNFINTTPSSFGGAYSFPQANLASPYHGLTAYFDVINGYEYIEIPQTTTPQFADLNTVLIIGETVNAGTSITPARASIAYIHGQDFTTANCANVPVENYSFPTAVSDSDGANFSTSTFCIRTTDGIHKFKLAGAGSIPSSASSVSAFQATSLTVNASTNISPVIGGAVGNVFGVDSNSGLAFVAILITLLTIIGLIWILRNNHNSGAVIAIVGMLVLFAFLFIGWLPVWVWAIFILMAAFAAASIGSKIVGS